MLRHFVEVTLAFGVFALLHSLLAIPAVKQRIQQWLGSHARWYRLLYNIKSVLLLGLIILIFPPRPELLYSVPAPYSWLMRGVQLIGALLFLRTLRDFDLRAFAGIDASGRPVLAEQREHFTSRGTFRYCRHPMYAAAMLFLIANPTVTIGYAAYALNFIAYFVLGSISEERHLQQQFGAEYAAYKARVPRFIPKLW